MIEETFICFSFSSSPALSQTHPDQNAFIMEHRVITAHTNEILTEHVKQITYQSKFRQPAQQPFSVTEIPKLYRHDPLSFFIESASAISNRNNGQAAIQ